jgi:hypothetical protein
MDPAVPSSVATLDVPDLWAETFFRELGEPAAERIDQMQTQLAGPDPVGRATSRRREG